MDPPTPWTETLKTETPPGQRHPSGQRPPWTETPFMVQSGQYASYWNAFLFEGCYRLYCLSALICLKMCTSSCLVILVLYSILELHAIIKIFNRCYLVHFPKWKSSFWSIIFCMVLDFKEPICIRLSERLPGTAASKGTRHCNCGSLKRNDHQEKYQGTKNSTIMTCWAVHARWDMTHTR